MVSNSTDPRRTRTRRSLVNAGAALLAEGGLEQLRMAEVAKHAEVSVSSLYVHFENKDELVAAVIEDALGRHRHAFDEARNADAAVDRVFAFGLAYLALAIHEPTAMRAMRIRALQYTGPGPSPVPLPCDNWLEQLAADVAGAIAAGDLPPLPPPTVLALLTSLWSGLAAGIVDPGEQALDADLVHDAFELSRSVLLSGFDPGTLHASTDA